MNVEDLRSGAPLKAVDFTPEDPAHYQRGKIQVWDFIADQGLDFFTGNVVKYACRAGHKDDKVQDLKKAKAYIDKLIDLCS
tara:strand:+ start:1790 stop:2032 length:243 start_codon:yes stop_codon:yes gene_type:complete